MILTNLILSAGIYSQAIALKEWKHEMFIRTEYEITQKYSASVRINSHREDAVIDGFDFIIYRRFGETDEPNIKWSGFIFSGRNVEDQRSRAGAGLSIALPLGNHLETKADIGYQREFGKWKREEKPNSMIMTWGLRWEF